MTLPNDYTRCMGVTPECRERLRCARHRDLPQDALLSWARNLNPDNLWDCPQYIPFEETDD